MRAKIKRMEIIIINDGSPDEAQTIIDKYEKKYPKLIKVISQKNHGIGYVRNVGLKNAKGKYIVSVDSDDTISKKYFKDALKYMKEDIDIIMCDWNTQYDYGTYQTPALDKVYDNIGAYKGLLYTTIMPSPCNKIVKKSLFTKIHLTYHEDIYEDLSAIPFILLTAKTIKYIPNPYYEYYIRSGSIMRSKPGNSMIDVINIINERLEKYKEKIKVDINEFKYYTYSWRIEEYIINPLYDLDEEKMLKSIKYIYDNFMPNLKELFESPLYEEMLNKLENKEKVKYIKERNKKVFEKKLEEFIKDKNKKNKIMKLTPPEIVYGKE